MSYDKPLSEMSADEVLEWVRLKQAERLLANDMAVVARATRATKVTEEQQSNKEYKKAVKSLFDNVVEDDEC